MKKQLQVGDVLNIKEMAQCIGISQKTFQNNRDKILLGLSEAYDIKLTYTKTGKISKFYIEGVNFEYEFPKYQHKNMAKKNKIYEEIIPEIIREQPYNTPANIARNISRWYDGDFKRSLGKSLSMGTYYNDTLQRCHEWYGRTPDDLQTFEDIKMNKRKGRIIERVWGIQDTSFEYKPLTQEQYDFLFKSFKHFVYESEEYQKEELDRIGAYDSHLITREEFIRGHNENKYARFVCAKKAFKDKYGKWPIMVNVYQDYSLSPLVPEGEFQFDGN